jgi:flagellar biosynthetic protein FlhB
MAEGNDESGDKQHEPTQRKLDDARKKGDVPRSADLNTAAAYGGLLLAAMALGAAAAEGFASALAALVARAPELAAQAFSGGDTATTGRLMAAVLPPLTPLFLLPAIAALLSVIAQRALVFAPSKLQPKLSRISILSNAKNKFGRSGLFEFAKSFVKLSIYSVILFLYLSARMPELMSSMTGTPGQVTLYLMQLSLGFLTLVLVVAVVLGGIDFFWQRAEHIRRNRMSHKDMMDEHKQAEGDPHAKQHRRQRAQEIAMNRMLADVPEAAVVVVNPTHYAVALKWDRAQPGAPVCVAKGVDEIAARIRERAMEAGVPIRRDPPTARAIFDSVEIGAEIRAEHFAAIAAAIRFAEEMRRKARAR